MQFKRLFKIYKGIVSVISSLLKPPIPFLGVTKRLTGYLFFFLITCLNFKTAKLSSMDVSVSVVWKSSSSISAMISPLFCIRFFCSLLSVTLERVFIFRDSSLILEKVSMLASVARTDGGEHVQALFRESFWIHSRMFQAIEPVEIFHQFAFLFI